MTPLPTTMGITSTTCCSSCLPTPSSRRPYLLVSPRLTNSMQPLVADLLWTSSPLPSKTDLHLILSLYLLILASSPGSETRLDCFASSFMVVGRPTLHSWSGTHTPNNSPCSQTVRLCCDDRRLPLHPSHSARFVRTQLQSTPHPDF